MAALVSHAMHRFPTSPPDAVYSSHGLRSEGSRHGGDVADRTPTSSTGALSRSMRYADPWLYGSVRSSGGLLCLAPTLVLCQCPDYLSGSKRSTPKKAPHLCKKCHGTRLPLSSIDSKFGTVRCYPTTQQITNTPLRAGTVRVTSSSRPSILPSPDPYDLMRRSRLSVPETTSTVSPFRDRTTPSNKSLKEGTKRSSSASRSKSTKQDTSCNSSSGRRSILECNVNPYDLMFKHEENKELKAGKAVAVVNGQRIRVRSNLDHHTDYEDVSAPKVTNISPKVPGAQFSSPKVVQKKQSLISPPTPPKLSEKESDYAYNTLTTSHYKSILKKRGSNYNSDSSPYSDPEETASPTSTRKSSSRFYIPIPLPLTPRKKVKFVDTGKCDSSEEEDKGNDDDVANSIASSQRDNRGEDEKEQNEDYDDVFEDPTDYTLELAKLKGEKGENNSQKIIKIHRSNSERIIVNRRKVDFFDSMALRIRKRIDSRIAFSDEDLEKLDGISFRTRKVSPRPNHPPPLPPSCQLEIDLKQQKQDPPFAKVPPFAFAYPENTDGPSLSNNITNNKEKSEPNNVTDDTGKKIMEICLNEKKQKKIINISRDGILLQASKEESRSQSSNSLKSSNESNFRERKVSEMTSVVNVSTHSNFSNSNHDAPPSAPPRKRSNNKQPLININKPSEVQTIKIESPQPENTNKTIVQVNSPTAFHKIQIKNEFPEYSDFSKCTTVSVTENPQRKTSIMINGDDCYSTVNVSDNVPLYQSSVVVKDEFSPVQVTNSKKNSSKIYITGTFISSTDTDKVLTEVSEHLNRLTTNNINTEAAKDQPVTEPKVEASNENKTILEQISNLPEIKIDDQQISNDKTETHQETERLPPSLPLSLDSTSSSELLKELLRDPVEAVRHNLVPHVCGKSDMSRRSRDTKFPKHLSPLGKSNSILESPLEVTNIPISLEDSFLRLRNYESIGDDACSEHSSTQYELMDQGSECYTDHSNRSSVTEEELANRTKFYELLAEAGNIEVTEGDDHHYESIKANSDPIYEEIEIPPPLPSNPPPLSIMDDLQLDKEYTTRSIFEGASKYDILSYLVDAKERGIVQEDGYSYHTYNNSNGQNEDETKEPYNRVSHMSTVSDSSEDNSLIISGALIDEKAIFQKPAEVERNDSGVGSETSKSSLSKYRSKPEIFASCEDCESPLESKAENEPLLCRKCVKKRSERKEIITEIVETEEKYSRDLQIILEEFYQPMLVAGLLTPDQLAAIFLNAEELLENSQALAERLRDAVEIALEQGDDDLLTVNIGKLFLEAAPMLHGFETYCVRQGTASLLLASLEKEKELLRIFLRVSQMENTMLRRMNLNSFLMVPVQRVTKYPLLLARLYKVTPAHHETREQLKEAQHKIELHLNHMNSETKDVPSKLWRRIGSSSGRRPSTEMDLVNIKLRKIAVDVLEWNHDEARFVLEGKLLFTQPTDNNWRKGRTIKLSPVNALLVINGKSPVSKPSTDKLDENGLVFSVRNSGVREAALLLVRDKNGRYSLLREPLYLDRCVIAADPAWQSYFEVQELLGKDTFIFKAEDEVQTHLWYKKLQYHAQGMGPWRKRRNALANIMINGMGLRS